MCLLLNFSTIVYDNLHIMVLSQPTDEEAGGRKWNPRGETVMRLLYVANGGVCWSCGIKRRLHLIVNESVHHAAGGEGEKRVISEMCRVLITEGRLVPRTAGRY